ncbi:DUF6397 family protein [Streptomyces sp. NPDC090106]|uniref:DUF6397 family protein n=1 Tax=Streptomyces sp. NPDC090106 TaxID=3365946 RepID=UPI003810AA89
MTGTVTTVTAQSSVPKPRRLAYTPSRAARELEIKRGEFDLAVHLGHIATVPDEGGGGRRVSPAEIERLRSQDGFPETLRERVRVVGTTEGAALMDVPVGRFTRLARLGLVAPVRFYLNRYRAVVWLYLAEDLERAAADERNAEVLTARRIPETLRELLDAGVDLRARNWRAGHRDFLLRQAEGPWESAGVLAAFLDPVRIGDLVPDPYERAYLHRFRPEPPAHGAPGSPGAHLSERIMTADDPDEIDGLATSLSRTLDDARRHRPAPRPSTERPAKPTAGPTGEPGTPRREGRTLLGWLRRRSA